MSSEEDSLVQRNIHTLNLNDPREEPVAKYVGICYMISFLLLSIPGVIGLVIAAQYETNQSSTICKINTYTYFIPLDNWLYVGCCISVLVSLLYMFINCYQTFGATLTVYSQISQLLLSQFHATFQCFITAFRTLWAIIGIYIYTNEMSIHCQSTSIGQMILIICIFELLTTCCVSVCAACMLSNTKDRVSLPGVHAGFMFPSTNQHDRQPSVSSSLKFQPFQ